MQVRNKAEDANEKVTVKRSNLPTGITLAQTSTRRFRRQCPLTYLFQRFGPKLPHEPHRAQTFKITILTYVDVGKVAPLHGRLV